jgi:hypothetical protein
LEIFVTFGAVVLTGNAIQILDQRTIKIAAPVASVVQSAPVVIWTPVGESEATMLGYIGTIPIEWTTGLIFSIQSPAVCQIGHDWRLYIGTTKEKIAKVTMNDNYTKAVNTITVQVNPNEEAM